jgi:hypothetical protein
MFRSVVETCVELMSLAVFVGMIGVWSQVLQP